MRLNLFIAKSGYASRRKADCLIKDGKVQVNSRRVYEPFIEVDREDKITVEGSPIGLKKHIYILFNKPAGVTTTLGDKFAKSKVVDFLPKQFTSRGRATYGEGIYPVGRLDKESCGLLVLTNDGDLCYRTTHPKFSVEKEYLVELKSAFNTSDCQRARRGLKVEGDYLKVDNIEVLDRNKKESLCRVVVCEGKKRHLRRLFKKLGFSVKELKRVRIGGLILGNLRSGEYRLIGKNKIYKALLSS